MPTKSWNNHPKILHPKILAVFACLVFFTPILTLAATPACICDYKITDKMDNVLSGEYCLYETIGVQETNVVLEAPGGPDQYCKGICRSSIQSVGDPNRFTIKLTRGWYLNDTRTGSANLAKCDQNKFNSAAVITSSDITPVRDPIIPILSVSIPKLKFSEPFKVGNKLTIDFIGEYFSAVYQWLIGVSLTISIIMIMIGGLQYVMSAGSSNVNAAKERITNAVIGFVLLLSTYAILYTVNPELTLLRPLTIEPIPHDPGLPFGEGEEASITGGVDVDESKLVTIESSDNIYNEKPNNAKMTPEMAKDVKEVAEILKNQGFGISISSGYRSFEKQLSLIKLNCQNPPFSATCKPHHSKPSTCMLVNKDPKNCPHTTAHAVDIWGTKADSPNIQCIYQKECQTDRPACFANECQAALIKAMNQKGYCVLNSEPWHFEKPKMSKNCVMKN